MDVEGVVHDDDPGGAEAHLTEAFAEYIAFRIRQDRRAMHYRHAAEGTLCFESHQMCIYAWGSLDDRIMDPRMEEGRGGR